MALAADRRGEAFGGALGELEIHRVDAAGISGRGPVAKLGALAHLGRGYLQARRLLRRLDPPVVVGFGSYPSAPTVLAAQHQGRKTVIHEQNAVLGRANRLLARRATRIATAFRAAAGLRAVDRDRAIWTGNPVRAGIVELRNTPYRQPGPADPLHILVFGGSQGAAVFAEVVPAALAELARDLRRRVRVVQQCRADEIHAVEETYREAGIEAVVAPFLDDIPERLAEATLVICRAGASTIAELAAAGRPAIMVPFPHATDDHQTANAEGLSDAGGGWIIQQTALTAAHLTERVAALLAPGPSLATAAGCAEHLGKPEAAALLADLIVDVIDGNGDSVGVDTVGKREAAA